ncbi:MAG: hypothetical protein V1738_03680 [Patescibacteria group bacterium]
MFRRSGGRCDICREILNKWYHAHHWFYRNLGDEPDYAVSPLCKDCHYRVEDLKKKDNEIYIQIFDLIRTANAARA